MLTVLALEATEVSPVALVTFVASSLNNGVSDMVGFLVGTLTVLDYR